MKSLSRITSPTVVTSLTAMNRETSIMNESILVLENVKTPSGYVDYAKGTKNRPVYLKKLGVFASQPLSEGNGKLDSKYVLIFDMLAIDTCTNCSSCKTACYAMKSQRQYPGVYNRRAIWSWMARHDLEGLESILDEQLTKTKLRIVRLHSSGDFINQDYLDMWARLIRKHAHISFYTYTKTSLDFTEISSLPNFNLVKSILPNGNLNFGSLSYIHKMAKKYHATICPYGIKGNTKIKCGKDCTACLRKEHVLFLMH
jgi:hypothetical protein